MEVLKTTSPMVSPSAPKDSPLKSAPSDNTSNALFMYLPLTYHHHRHPLQNPSLEGRIPAFRNKLLRLNPKLFPHIYYCNVCISINFQCTLVYTQNPCGIQRHFFDELRHGQNTFF